MIKKKGGKKKKKFTPAQLKVSIDVNLFQEKGNTALNEGDPGRAIGYYTEAIDLEPSNEQFYSNRKEFSLYNIGSHAYLKIEDFDNAIADADKVIQLKPSTHQGYVRKAAALREIDKLQEAITLLKGVEEKFKGNELVENLLKELEDEHALDNVLPKDHPEILRFERFAKWLRDGGADFDKVKMRYYSADYRGVHAKYRIRKNEVLVRIPLNLIITLEMAKEAPIGAKMLKANLKLLSPKHSFLSSYVLQELKKPDTKWLPYLDMLPKSTNNFPIFFTEEEKAWLTGSPFLDQVEGKIRDVNKDYKKIVEAVPEFAQFTLNEFSHVRMLISSRIFCITVNGNKTDSLVPLADMLNHRCPQQTSWEYKEDAKGFVIDVKEAIPRGDEIYDSYGRKCNSRFFMNYGFILKDNEDNEVPIKIWLDEDDPLYTTKLIIIEKDDPKTIRVSENPNNRNIDDFFSYLRFTEFEGDSMKLYKYEFEKANKKRTDENDFYETYHGAQIPPLSIDSEIRILKKTIVLAEKQLSMYKTTYEEDLKILEENKDLTFNQRNCVLMRSGEKRILIKLSELGKLGLELINLPLKKAREIYGKMKDKAMYDRYVIGMLFPFMAGTTK